MPSLSRPLRVMSAFSSALLLILCIRQLQLLWSVQVNLTYQSLAGHIPYYDPRNSAANQSTTTTKTTGTTPPDPTLCERIRARRDLTIIVKTGATEAWARIPVLLSTFLSCTYDFLIFSDMEEDILGHHIIDALEDVEDKRKNEHPDFELYRLQQQYRQDGMEPSKLVKDYASAAWNLDVYKSGHVAEKAYKMRPNSSWYLFIDADTYVSWSSLLPFLDRLDPEERIYMGSVSVLNNIPFAHGGSGYLLSQASMAHLARKAPGVGKLIEKHGEHECCGDYEIAMALHNVGITLQQMFPMFNGQVGETMRYSPSRWCEPIITMHHMLPRQVNEMWTYETARTDSGPFLFMDLYNATTARDMVHTQREDWNNLPDGDRWGYGLRDEQQEGLESFEKCRAECIKDPGCLQFRYISDHQCHLADEVTLGEKQVQVADVSYRSGWQLDRIADVVQTVCPEPNWIQGWDA